MHEGLWGGVVGTVGGIVGTYFSVKNTQSPQERKFVIKCAVGFWLGIAVFLALLFLLPIQYRWLLWIPYVIALPITIIWMNKTQARIRGQAGVVAGAVETADVTRNDK
ncbi:MAG: hypothetical protein IH987_07705 [Planctomycetes bacterium]|nr:hypothetical protein [Planctomycetota bacterium]